jgi:hypothetical protein
MIEAKNIINNSALDTLAKQAGQKITGAIQQASHRTGVNFAYLMEQAAAESSFNSEAKASTSSAQGLYQFIEKTWLNMVKKHGHKYGMGAEAQAIHNNKHIEDKQIRENILKLRNDPQKAAYLAAEFASENKDYLLKNTSADIGSTELYLAHFLGASGAAGFLNALDKNPLMLGRDIFPEAARANKNVFYDRKSGKARTLIEIHAYFDKKFQGDKTNNPAKDALIASEKSYQSPAKRTDYTGWLNHSPINISSLSTQTHRAELYEILLQAQENLTFRSKSKDAPLEINKVSEIKNQNFRQLLHLLHVQPAPSLNDHLWQFQALEKVYS